MDEKFTPGPWRAAVDSKSSKKHCTDDVHTDNGARICRMTGNVKYAHQDARLIAAAPDMYEVLSELEDSSSYWS